MPEFEVAVYNQEVRDRLAEGRRHRDLADSWADVHYIEIQARDEADARNQVLRKYPAHRGYVIDSVERAKY